MKANSTQYMQVWLLALMQIQFLGVKEAVK